MIVGEAWSEQDEQRSAPFSGTAGGMLRSLLRQAGIAESDCYLTNVFNRFPAGGRLENFCGPKATAIPNYRPLFTKPDQYVRVDFQHELHRLYTEIRNRQPNVILAMGNVALWALCKKQGIKKYRGSPLETFDLSTEIGGDRLVRKVIPTWHPNSVMRQYGLRPIVLADVSKTRRECLFPELRRPSHLIYMNPDLQDIEDFYHEFLVGQPFLSCDIETIGLDITEVGYSTADGSRAIVLPFYDREKSSGNFWPTLEQERAAWAWVRRINTEFPMIGQNFSYDMKYFWKRMGIPCPKFLGDTMLQHHSLQPELEKSLGFLGSIYTNEPSWKFMRNDHSTLKKED